MKYLLKIYNEVVDDASHYKKLYKSIQDYQLDLEDTFQKYINVISSKEEQIKICLNLLSLYADTRVVYLGLYEALRANNYSYLDRALNTYTKLSMLIVMQCGTDHSVSSLKRVPFVFSLKRFEDIEKIYPKNCGLSTKKVWGSVVTNLIMYLYYQENMWKEQVINSANQYLCKNDSLEYQSIVKALLSLVERDFKQFSLELSNICKGRKRTKDFGENKFSRSVSFYSLGLYNFAKYLYPDDVDKITLPTDDNFLTDYLYYQQSRNFLDEGYIIDFTEELALLKIMFLIDTPPISLMKEGKNYEVDYISYNQLLVKKIMNNISKLDE